MNHQAFKFGLRPLLAAAALCICAITSTAADGFRSVLLSDMADAMKMRSNILELPEGSHVGKLKHGGKPVTVVVKDGKVCHIGYSIFTADHREQAYSPFFDAIERYCMMNKLPLHRDKDVNRELFEEGIHIDTGSLDMLPTLYNKTNTEFSLANDDGKKYHAVWTRDDKVVADITMPFTYGQLHGTSMEENENILISELMAAAAKGLSDDMFTTTDVKRESLVSYFPFNYFILPGETYYFDNLTNNKYYTKADSTSFAPIYDPYYSLESLANVSTGLEVPNDLQLKVKIIQYNYRNTELTLPLSSFVKYCLDNGCTPFFGLVDRKGDTLICQVIMRNVDEGYCHLLKITAEPTPVGVATPFTLKGRMNPYIPISKITALFADPTESEQVKDRPTRTIKFKKK